MISYIFRPGYDLINKRIMDASGNIAKADQNGLR
jgi:hypothetical protein